MLWPNNTSTTAATAIIAPSNRQQLSRDVYLEVTTEDYQKCSVLCTTFEHNDTHTHTHTREHFLNLCVNLALGFIFLYFCLAKI